MIMNSETDSWYLWLFNSEYDDYIYIYKPWNLGKNHQGQPKNYWAFFQVPTILFSEVGMMEICPWKVMSTSVLFPQAQWNPKNHSVLSVVGANLWRTPGQIHRFHAIFVGSGHKANSPVGSGASAHGHCCVSIANKTRSCPQKNRQPRVKTTKMTKMTKIATDSTIPSNFLNKYWWLWWHGNGDDHEISWKCDNFPESEAKSPNCLLGSL